jgi:glucokinase
VAAVAAIQFPGMAEHPDAARTTYRPLRRTTSAREQNRLCPRCIWCESKGIKPNGVAMGQRGSRRGKPPPELSMSVSPDALLLADIGATNARFAFLSKRTLGPVRTYSVSEFPRFIDVVNAFLEGEDRPPPVHEALFAVAGPVDVNRCVLTNCPWVIEAMEVRAAFRFADVRLCNDFEAVALSLPQLTSTDLFSLGGGAPVAGKPMAVLGAGSGLGLAGLIPDPSRPVVIPGEGGHVTMAATDEREAAILAYLRGQFGHLSAERVISGPGLENLYRAVAAIDGIGVPERDAAAITCAALDGSCPLARSTLEVFCAMLGTFAGNVALTFGARGGVYIAGGIAPRITEFMARSQFRARFEQKGRLRPYLEAIPVSVIVQPAATFLGLAAMAGRSATVAAGSPPEGVEPR